MRTHRDIEQRSLALHTAIAEKLSANPALLEIARENLDRWYQKNSRARPYLDRWKEILKRPLPEIVTLLKSDTEENLALKQSSPFCGILTPKERWKIYETFGA